MQFLQLSESKVKNHREVQVVSFLTIIAVIIGALLRLKDLTKFSLNYDELFTVAAAFDAGENTNIFDFTHKLIPQLNESDSFLTWKGADGSPPLFDVLLKTWGWIFSESDFSLRLFASLIGIAIPIVFYLGLKNLIGPFALFMGTSFLSFSNSLIYYSKYVRSYSLVALLALSAWIVLYRLYLNHKCAKKSKGLQGLLVGLLTLLSYTHYTGLLLSGFIFLL
jgi:predicted membrane-bound mannosyltransferase